MEVGGDDYDYGAFIQRIELRPTPRAPEEPSLPLQGLTFAVKDMYALLLFFLLSLATLFLCLSFL